MPLHRQQQRFERDGVSIADTTMVGWVQDTCYSMTALYTELRKSIIHSAMNYMTADETTIRVLDSDRPTGKKSQIGYMWSYCNPVDKLVKSLKVSAMKTVW